MFATLQNGFIFWAGLTIDASSLVEGVEPLGLVRYAIYPLIIGVIGLLAIQFNFLPGKRRKAAQGAADPALRE